MKSMDFDHKRSLREWLQAAFTPDEFVNLAFHCTTSEQGDWPDHRTTPRGVFFSQIVDIIEKEYLTHNEHGRICFFAALRVKRPLLRHEINTIETHWKSRNVTSGIKHSSLEDPKT